MAQESLLVSFVLGVGLIAAVVALVGRGRRQYSVVGGWSRSDRRSLVSRGADSPAVWTAAFVGLTLAFGIAAVLYVGGVEVSGTVALGGAFLLGAATLVFTLYVFYGTFVSARNRGLKDAQAAFLGVWAIGSLFVVAITFKLLGLF